MVSCVNCNGTGKISCKNNCRNGYFIPSPFVLSYSWNIEEKENQKYDAVITNTAIQNNGVPGNVKIVFEIRRLYTNKILGSYEVAFPMGSETKTLSEIIRVQMGDLSNLRNTLKRELKKTDFNLTVNAKLTDKGTKCEECDEEGFIGCEECKGAPEPFS